jgi:chorismate synthase
MRSALRAAQFELDRRRPGQSRITTPRNEEDTCEILSGTLCRRAAPSLE